jgi:hypothetical protein
MCHDAYLLFSETCSCKLTCPPGPDTSACVVAESTMRIVAGERGNLTLEQARPWRNSLSRILSPEAVARQQLPIFAPVFAARLHDVVARGESVLWYEESRTLAFSVAARATLGSLLSEADLAAMYPQFQDLSKGAFALVRRRRLFVCAQQ